MQWRLVALMSLVVIAAAGIVFWAFHGALVNDWLVDHTGISNESGPWYGFWSGFGSDLAELGIIGAVGTAAYQLVKRYNCHEPGCWRVGTHPAADGQFLLCYRHHPDYQGKKPTHEMIARLHADHVRRQEAFHERLHDVRAGVETRHVESAEVGATRPVPPRGADG
jgi:hypothetical protein